MSDRSTLEQVLELLINEEKDAAENMLHDFIVAEARRIHEELLNDSDEVVEEDLEDIDESEAETDQVEEKEEVQEVAEEHDRQPKLLVVLVLEVEDL